MTAVIPGLDVPTSGLSGVPQARSDRVITADLMARLEAHYLKPSDRLPSGVFLHEVGWNGTANSRRCDALYVGFTSTSGRLLVGHEVKASRSDWLNELRQLDKADCWADQCHQWWLVTVPGVVRDGELPPGWGLMLPGTGRARLKVVTRADTYLGRTPSWDTCRSVIARLNTLHRDRIVSAVQEARQRQNEVFDALAEREVGRRVPTQADESESRGRLDRIQAVLGGELSEWSGTGRFTEDDLRLAGEWLRARQSLERGAAVLGRSHARDHLRDQLEQVSEALTKLAELERALAGLGRG